MKLNLMIIVSNLMLILLIGLVLAATAHTEYEGSGDLSLSTSIDLVSSTTEVHTGCADACPCCCCSKQTGSYGGEQYVSSDPKTMGDVTTTENGCAEQHKTIVDETDGKTTYTSYDTVMDGTGSLSTYYHEGSAYQETSGSGTAYVSYSQYQDSNGKFNYATQTSGEGIDDNAYAGLLSYYDVSYPNYQAFEMYVLGSNTHGWFYLNSTDKLDLDLDLFGDDIIWSTEIKASGRSIFLTSVDSDHEMYVKGEVEID